ncbi:3-deoxy-D-manno-octulosonic acid transferase [Terasakiella sp. A23]|uniref:3-deoxy-D-manno-octulosonic acid transferase n=1 Tax=Terasakiella sp. FCG-A23 TaxID=3080561 RepID=UPI002955A1D6|nr:3-deoxy-D-manno-octulosonic acid transferase [Terasakiella sp. A23]MDV7338025.1 3-deoxy-D-manno-octulosonic acid transferase [Terasakiella sp. A23]
MIFSLYRLATNIAAPIISRYLKKRLEKGKEHPTRFSERLGIAGLPRPAGKLIWLHGASVGEAISLLTLINKLKTDYPHFNILVTTGTVTSAELLANRLPEGVIHQFVPVDRLPYVRKFLDHWKPDIAFWAESELWPNLLHESHKRGIHLALINARMSEKSLKSWMRFKGFIAGLLNTFDICLAQTEKDGGHYRQLGAKNVQCVGNLKYASPALPYDTAELDRLTSLLKDRALWLAASTHPGEETLLARVHNAVKKTKPNLLTIIAPRHPHRGDDIRAELEDLGLSIAQRSNGDQPCEQTDIYLCDTMGEMGLLYRLSDLVFMGKSMEPLGGQNPLEPARLDCAVLCGPYMTNFTEIMDRFQKNDAITVVADEVELAKKITHLLNNQTQTTELAKKAKDVALAEAAVLDRIMDKLNTQFQLDEKGA